MNLATLHQPGTMPSKSALNVSLTPELTAFVAAKVDSGRYRSASEVVREALRQLEQQDRRNTAVEVATLTNGR
jgi:antitoxin ParD1/3/4